MFLFDALHEFVTNRQLSGGKRPRIYQTWSNMKKRCYYKKYTGYHNYGGRGIKVCNEWQYFQNFKKWAMKNGYDSDLTIDRIDNDKDYSPDKSPRLVHPHVLAFLPL